MNEWEFQCNYVSLVMLGNEENFHAKPSRREEDIFNQESKWHNNHIVHKDFTLETQTEKTTFLENSSPYCLSHSE